MADYLLQQVHASAPCKSCPLGTVMRHETLRQCLPSLASANGPMAFSEQLMSSAGEALGDAWIMAVSCHLSIRFQRV